MKRTYIRFCCFLFCLPFFLVACAKKSYRNDLSAMEVAATLSESIGLDADFGDRTMLSDQIIISSDSDLTVCTAKDGTNIDEFGVWHTENPAQARRQLETYLERSYQQNKAYYDSYIPDQTPKLRDAEVRIFGSYAVYAVLDPEQKANFFRAAEKLLSG